MQAQEKTIEHTLITSFERTFHQPVRLWGASRTDAGVHAFGQVVKCQTTLDLDGDRLCYAWNRKLPCDIRIRSIERIAPVFDPRSNVHYKTYHYYIFETPPSPFMHRYGWFSGYHFDKEYLKKIVQLFVGTHDFRSFCTGDHYAGGTIRNIDAIWLDELPDIGAVRITFVAERFMRYMIRRLVGAAMAVAGKKFSLENLVTIFHKKDPAHHLPAAPACGLFLHEIIYRS